MAQPEQKFKRKVRRALNDIPRSWFFAVIPGIGMIGGVPDYVGLVCGRFVGIEVKTETGRLTTKQWGVRRLVRNAGGIIFVVRPSTLHDMTVVLNEIVRRAQGRREHSITDHWTRLNPPDPELR